MKRRKHLLGKEHRSPEGRCLTSSWGPYCPICQEKGYKELSKKIKPMIKYLKNMTEEEKKKWAEDIKKKLEDKKPNSNMLKWPRRPDVY